jgi:hypothetical protein
VDTKGLAERPGPEAFHSSSFNAETKNKWSYTAASACAVMAYEVSFSDLLILTTSFQ